MSVDKHLPLTASGPGIWRMRANGTPFPGLPAAIAAVRDAHPNRPDLQALAWALLPRLPGKPRTSANLKEEGASSRLNPLEDVVVSDPWLGVNTENAVNVLWVETDKPGLAERLALMREWGVPVQTWTACGSRGGHVAFNISEPVVTDIPGREDADKKRIRKLSLVRSYLNTAIDGDRSAGLRGMTKNPFSARWTVEVGDVTPRTLDEILQPLQAMAEALGWEAPKRRYRGDRKREPSPEGRNCHLFDLTRWWAADEFVRDGAAILDKAVEINAGFAVPLGYGEVASVARSITRFMQTRYDGRGRHVPMSPKAVQECQAVAGRATVAVRTASRDAKLTDAVARLRQRGGPLGQADIAAEAGVSLWTVQRAWTVLWEVFVNTTPLAPPISDGSAIPPPKGGRAFPSEAPCLPADAVPCPLDDAPAVPSCPSPPQGHEDSVAEAMRMIRLSGLTCSSDGPLPDLTSWSPETVAGITRLASAIYKTAQFPAIDWSPEAVAKRRRQASRRRCAKREAWHVLAARGGLRAYRDAVASRFAALFRERNQALAAAQEWQDVDVDPLALAAAREQTAQGVMVIRMAYAAKVKAETRISRRVDDELQVQERGTLTRFRTVPDALDRLAMMSVREPECGNVSILSLT